METKSLPQVYKVGIFGIAEKYVLKAYQEPIANYEEMLGMVELEQIVFNQRPTHAAR
jgi:hypothetical protein